MKTTQYVRQEKAIAFADSGGIRQRWLFGLRLLRDPEAMSSEKSLKHGVTEQIVAAAKAAGLKLTDREIRRRIQCARTYPTEDQIGRVTSDFASWFDLLKAEFPAYPAPNGEPLADHRTEEERRRDAARRLLDIIGEQGTLFPFDQFEPTESTLKELAEYADRGEAITASFAAHDAKRRAYLDELIEVADGDLSMTWQAAHELLADDESHDAGQVTA